jgi:dTDP-4-dehydrorhamnose 3,5-epimerase
MDIKNRPQFLDTQIDGVKIYLAKRTTDSRGNFCKTYSEPAFYNNNISMHADEELFSTSNKYVLRGMHYQSFKAPQTKQVQCIHGKVLDVVLDIRENSKTFGHYFSIELSPENSTILHIPAGLAHGFLALEDQSIMHYRCNGIHSSLNEYGIKWNSFGYKWPVVNPTLSDRDEKFPNFNKSNLSLYI